MAIIGGAIAPPSSSLAQPLVNLDNDLKALEKCKDVQRGGCSSVGRLVIGRSLVQIPVPGRAELHVEVSLSEMLNPTLLISEHCPCDELATCPREYSGHWLLEKG